MHFAMALLVLFLLLFIIARYNRRANPVASKTSHNTLLEVIWTGVPVLILVGFVYICETLSDIIQVGYFKLTHGKRVFKMAPLHHHFEMCGWSEVKLVTIFTLVSAVFCMLALWGVIGRYHF